MNLFDWMIVLVIIILVILAIRASRKNACTGECSSCQTSCSSKNRKPGDVPDFVRRYREDHPKTTPHS